MVRSHQVGIAESKFDEIYGAKSISVEEFQRRSGMPESLIMEIGGWQTASGFRRYAITDRRTKAAAMRQYERYQHELAKIRAENAHTSLILDPLDPQIDPLSKLR